MKIPSIQRHRGFTLIELLVGLAVLVILITIAAPAMRDFIVMQRLKSTAAELVTDLQFARSEAIARNASIFAVQFKSSTTSTPPMSCYMLYIPSSFGGNCDCTRPVGSACTGSSVEIRTTQIPISYGIQVLAALPVTSPLVFLSDGLSTRPSFLISSSRVGGGSGQIQTTVTSTGRVASCTPDQSVPGFPSC